MNEKYKQKRVKILYLGNQLMAYGSTPTSVETLGEQLKSKFEVIQGSDKKNKLLRLFHMWWVVVKNKDADYLLIDTYSTSSFHYAWTSAILSRWFRIRYIPILHGGDLPLRAKRSSRLLKYFLKNAYEVVCPSNFLKIKMEKVVGGNYLVIPNFIDLENYSFQPKSINEKNGIRILWVRSFHEIYNPYLALKVLHQLHNEGYHRSQLCMVGPDKDGSLKKVKLLAMELGLNNFITFTGRLSQKEWISLSSDYNIFINTTNVDNTPVSVIEAMALGLPVVSTRVGGIPFLLKDRINALLVEENNTNQMKEAVLYLFKNPEFTIRQVNNGRKLAESFDWKTVNVQWADLLN